MTGQTSKRSFGTDGPSLAFPDPCDARASGRDSRE